MEHLFKKFLSLALLLSTGAALADCGNSCDNDCDNNTRNTVVTCLTPRSQSFNNVIKNACLDPDHQFQDEMDNFNGNFSIALEYSQTFRDADLAGCYWGPAVACPASDCDDNGVIVRVKGSQRSPNGTSDLVADNFFLSPDFESALAFSPSIKNINVHFQFYAGLDEWANGLYFRLYAPVTNSRWDLDVCETMVNKGTVGFAAGVIAPGAVPASALFQDFTSFARGTALSGITGVVVQPLKYTKFACDTLTETKLADLRAELGWNFCMNEDYHFGLYIEAAAPTGNKCCPEFLFGPVVGNGHYWELGGGLTAHYTFWRSCDSDKQFDFFIDATVTHLFQHDASRTFDLVNKPLSRYIIAEQMTTTVADLQVAANEGFASPNAQFNAVYAPVANFSTQDVDVSIAAQGEVTAKFVYTCSGFSWELGYDFYGRSCEDISYDCDCNGFKEKTWALRGDSQVYGFVDDSANTVALGATRNAANVFSLSGDGAANVVTTTNTVNNNNVDKPVQAFSNDLPLRALANSTGAGASTINTSNPAQFITLADIDFAGAETRLISNKIFTNFSYTWIGCEDWIPYVGIGASVEFGSTGNSNDCCPNNDTTVTTNNCNSDCDNDCNSCIECTPSQWAVWIKGGLSFN